MTVEEPMAAASDLTPAVRRGYLVDTTRAIFYVLGITQPAPEHERAVALAFWAAVLALSVVCLGAVVSVIVSVSLLK